MAPATRPLRAFSFQHRFIARVLSGATLLSVLSAHAFPFTSHPTFEHAEQLQQALQATPQPKRTKHSYEKVLNAYRAIYHGNPASPKADASINAVAGLLAEEARLFSDEKLFYSAIDQYEFLRTQYPASRYRFSALISEGEIYRRDLDDRPEAKQTFEQFLVSYPKNPLAEQARTELNEIRQQEHPVTRKAKRTSRHPAQNVLTAARDSQQTAPANIEPQPATAPAFSAIPHGQPAPPSEEHFEANSPVVSAAAPLHPGRIALVSGIRHWSTPVYTRIAIDLGDQVAYEAARVPDPDRIYFDLHGARLEPALNGKSVEVVDDGFLKKIRAAQFSNNVTRIVLDVSSVSDYSAFLLPNPWRLIIDVHGRKPGAEQPLTLAAATPAPAAPSPDPVSATPAPDAAPPATTAKLPATKTRRSRATTVASAAPAAAVATTTNTVADSRNGTQEIASLGQQPDRIEATNSPTTRPIAATVAGTTPAPQADDGSLASPNSPQGSVRKHKKPSPGHPAANVVTDGEADSPPMARDVPRAAEPTSAGQRSLVRTLGLKIGRIVIDAGHGGHDSGTLGPGGIEEKEVVLDVALRVGKLLKQRLGADVIFTRADDTFIPLETRTAIANKAQADLFLSIHANSSSDSSARGVETYYLNFTTSPDALEVAARENAVSNESIHELSDLVKKITLKDKIDESREFATDVQKSLYNDLEDGNPGLRDRGVKKAPFVVLIGANMPSILAEISFLTNTEDARELRLPAYRQRIAEAIYRGVAVYISGLSGIRLAQGPRHPTGN